jgi:hypothetical protein
MLGWSPATFLAVSFAISLAFPAQRLFVETPVPQVPAQIPEADCTIGATITPTSLAQLILVFAG